MPDIFISGPQVQFTNAASLLIRAAMAEDQHGNQKAIDMLYNMFQLGGHVQANYGTCYKYVQAGMDDIGEMFAIGILQKRLSECEFEQATPTGLLVGHVFDSRDKFWRSHS